MGRFLRNSRSSVGSLVATVVLAPGLATVAVSEFMAGHPTASVLVSTGLMLLGAGAAASIVRRRVLNPLADVVSALELVASGEPAPILAFPESPEVDRAAGAFNRMTATVVDSTSRLEHQAFHDTLTALPNRASFMSSFSRALMRAQRTDATVAVLFMDVDRFKHLNDSLGHGIGDQLLSVLSRRLTIAAKDHMVARLGGDEFTILIEGNRAESEALSVAEGIMDALRWPIALSGQELFVSMSIGIAVSSPADSTITELLRKADIALYRSKADGRGRFTLFHPEQDGFSAEKFALDSELRRSVQRDELMLHFQPIVNLRTQQITGMEALLRWNHPHRGILSPATFISIAEETGDIVHIGHWVLERACRQAVQLQKLRPEIPLNLSVNVSAAEFRQRDLPQRLARVLRQTGMPPAQLELELTETVLIKHLSETLPVLRAIKAMGVRLAIDDFGTGYSSLAYLEHLPVDALKIDQSFVARLGVEQTTAPVVRAIVELGRSLGMEVIAEGVETEAQMNFLAGIGCGFGQGYYFRGAVPAAEFGELLRAGAAVAAMPARKMLRKAV